MEFDNCDSRPGKPWNLIISIPGPGTSHNFMLANVYAAEMPTVIYVCWKTHEITAIGPRCKLIRTLLKISANAQC